MSLEFSIDSINPKGLLSFGFEHQPLRLGPLNVLIGPNASGKSNLIDILRLVRGLPNDLPQVIRRGGGADDWIWKGTSQLERPGIKLLPTLTLNLSMVHPLIKTRYEHKLVLNRHPQAPSFWIDSELIEEEWPTDSERRKIYESDFRQNIVRVKTRDGGLASGPFQENHQVDQSGIYQFRSRSESSDISQLASNYQAFGIYDAWQFGRETVLRSIQAADLRTDRLEEEFSNLFIFLNHLQDTPEAKSKIIEGMQDLYQRFVDYSVLSYPGTRVLLSFIEEVQGTRKSVSAVRLSDGTLRYLCLLAILYNPSPPPVVCIEEPELGLHPDIVVRLARHLQAASERMQLIVTTHSDILVDALSDVPESIVIFDNEDGATKMNRLKPDELGSWLENYRLGELWTSGQIGGTRW